MQEVTTNELIMTDFAPEVVKCFFDLMYTVPEALHGVDFPNKLEVLRMADKYNADIVKTSIVQELRSILTVENCLSILDLADALSCQSLKQFCVAYVKANICAFEASDLESMGLVPVDL